MLRSLFTAITGLDSHKTAMDVIGHNLANVNTVGYKKERAFFQELFSQTLSGATAPTATRPGRNPVQVGLGVRIAAIDSIFTQGALENTGNPTDVAIEGRGFFVVKYGNEIFYTRAGNFKFDAIGALVDPNGYRVQGYTYNEETGEWEQALTDIYINPNEQLAPKATDIITLKANLSSSATGNTYETWMVGPFKDSASQTIVASSADTFKIPDCCMAKDISTGDYIEILGTKHNGESVSGKFYLNVSSASVTVGASSVTITTSATVSPGSTVDGGYVIIISSSNTADIGKIYGPGDTVDTTANVTVKAVGTFEDLRRYLQYLFGEDYKVAWDENGDLKIIDKTCGPSMMSLRMRFVDADVTGSTMDLPKIWVDVEGKYADTHLVSTTIYDKTGQAHELKIHFVKIQGEDAEDDGSFFTSGSSTDDPSVRKTTWVYYTELDGRLLEIDGAAGRVDFDSQGNPRITYYYAHFNYTTAGGSATYDIGAFGSLPGLGNAVICPEKRCPNNLNVDIDGDGNVRFVTSSGSTVNVTLASLNDTGAALGIHLENYDPSLFDAPIVINTFDQFGNTLLTALGGDSRTYFVDQNGYPAGDLVDIEIDDTGVVQALYTNGKTVPRYRLALAGFNNEQGLERIGNNLFRETPASGSPFYASPGEAGLGTVRSGTLEMSNVDIAEEFTKMIVVQRGFQANARVITTSDEMLRDIIALKR